ncbi:MAG: M28 family peptidase [Deltaproteobacteria bacterium]|jgi:aminopeptidase YwaD|nr:M28 family peptidase [Deltaproteobacteria bacterium]MBW2537451.1 M28 family peptidase [Deltaproteobacteria bacterium]
MALRGVFNALAVAGALIGCSSASTDPPASDPYGDPAAVQARLAQTLDDLAQLGEKRAGTEAGRQAGDYLRDRFEAAGLNDVGFESFSFLGYEVSASSFAVEVDGAPLAMEHGVFAYSGAGNVAAEVVDVGVGRESDYAGVDAAGKVVLVTRDPVFHRSSQYRLVIDQGGVAMLYVSQAPDNLVQIGTVADPEDGMGPIPSVTVGTDDGDAIADALADGLTVTATIDVDASVLPAQGRNVVGQLPGATPDAPYLLLGAHYDTWYVGSADNTTGVAALVEIAEASAHHAGRTFGLRFVAYDGEELGLFGGYDYLRDHVVVDEEPMLAFLNFEMPAAGEQGLRVMASSAVGPMDAALTDAGLTELYTMYVGLELIPALFGGVIPTDIQGAYWHGVQGMITACDSPYYHTTEDTPEKIDVPFLAEAVLGFERALAALDRAPAVDFSERDPAVWSVEATTANAADGLDVTVAVTDAAGVAQGNAVVRVRVDVDDFTRTFDETTVADGDGQVTVNVPATALAAGSGERWLHVTAGDGYPLAERVLPLP